MARVTLKALRTFSGTEGFIKKGSTFSVINEGRAKDLESRGLAERAEEKQTKEITPGEQPENKPDEQPGANPSENRSESAPETSPDSSEDGPDSTFKSYGEQSLSELRKTAASFDIEGRSKMDREELLKALEKKEQELFDQ